MCLQCSCWQVCLCLCRVRMKTRPGDAVSRVYSEVGPGNPEPSVWAVWTRVTGLMFIIIPGQDFP